MLSASAGLTASLAVTPSAISTEADSVFDRLHHPEEGVLVPLLVEATTDGTIPPDTDIQEAFLQLLSPLVMAALMEPDSADDRLADRLVELFLASRPPTPVARPRSGARARPSPQPGRRR